MECHGHEVSLEDCKVDWISKDCDHKRDVSVDCDFLYNQGIASRKHAYIILTPLNPTFI